jgi:hypothetical protein
MYLAHRCSVSGLLALPASPHYGGFPHGKSHGMDSSMSCCVEPGLGQPRSKGKGAPCLDGRNDQEFTAICNSAHLCKRQVSTHSPKMAGSSRLSLFPITGCPPSENQPLPCDTRAGGACPPSGWALDVPQPVNQSGSQQAVQRRSFKSITWAAACFLSL